MADPLESAIDRVAQLTDASHEELADRAVLEHDGWTFGERVRVSDEADVLAGQEGYVVVQTVGAPEYGNVRTVVQVVPDGSDSWDEVDPMDLEAI